MKSLLRKSKNQRGQGTVEYIIIVVVIAIAAIAVISIFGDRIRELFSGAASSLGADDASSQVQEKSQDILKGMTESGVEDN